MKPILLSFLLSLTAFCDISVIISPNNPLAKISQKELADLYLKKTDTIHGIKVIPIDSTDTKTYQEFYQKIVQKNPEQIHAYWVNQIYTGDKQPPEKLSLEELSHAMKKNNKIIAYSSNPLDGTITLSVK